MHFVRFFKTKRSSILTRLKAGQIRSLFTSAKPFKITKPDFLSFSPQQGHRKKTSRVFSDNSNPATNIYLNSIRNSNPPQIIPPNINSNPQINQSPTGKFEYRTTEHFDCFREYVKTCMHLISIRSGWRIYSADQQPDSG